MMFDPSVLEFLRGLAAQPEKLAALRTCAKPDVLAQARADGFAFDEAGFDATIWQTEIAIAGRIGEPFDFDCSMWETMWGKHYLDYLVQNVATVATPDWPELAARAT